MNVSLNIWINEIVPRFCFDISGLSFELSFSDGVVSGVICELSFSDGVVSGVICELSFPDGVVSGVSCEFSLSLFMFSLFTFSLFMSDECMNVVLAFFDFWIITV
jgi:hypothetical protein